MRNKSKIARGIMVKSIAVFLVLAFVACQREISPLVTDNVPSYILVGSQGNCSDITPAGTYKKGIALSGSNTITIKVDVRQSGNWKATTNMVDGIKFYGTGSF